MTIADDKGQREIKMKRKKRILGSCIVALVLNLSMLKGVYAGEPPPASRQEPFGYALLFAGGITIAAIRRWKSKRHSNTILK